MIERAERKKRREARAMRMSWTPDDISKYLEDWPDTKDIANSDRCMRTLVYAQQNETRMLDVLKTIRDKYYHCSFRDNINYFKAPKGCHPYIANEYEHINEFKSRLSKLGTMQGEINIS